MKQKEQRKKYIFKPQQQVFSREECFWEKRRTKKNNYLFVCYNYLIIWTFFSSFFLKFRTRIVNVFWADSALFCVGQSCMSWLVVWEICCKHTHKQSYKYSLLVLKTDVKYLSSKQIWTEPSNGLLFSLELRIRQWDSVRERKGRVCSFICVKSVLFLMTDRYYKW